MRGGSRVRAKVIVGDSHNYEKRRIRFTPLKEICMRLIVLLPAAFISPMPFLAAISALVVFGRAALVHTILATVWAPSAACRWNQIHLIRWSYGVLMHAPFLLGEQQVFRCRRWCR
jgi:hypothetical protein